MLKEHNNITITLDIVVKVRASQKNSKAETQESKYSYLSICKNPFMHSSHNKKMKYLMSQFLGSRVSFIASLDRFCITLNGYGEEQIYYIHYNQRSRWNSSRIEREKPILHPWGRSLPHSQFPHLLFWLRVRAWWRGRKKLWKIIEQNGCQWPQNNMK